MIWVCVGCIIGMRRGRSGVVDRGVVGLWWRFREEGGGYLELEYSTRTYILFIGR